MILWVDGAHDAPEQMRRDAALLEAFERGAASEPVLRIYEFRPPGITLGHAQDPARELDLERCRRDGVAWAVRPTGGRAIYHDDAWTYALASPIADPEWGGRLADAYARASRLLVASLRRLGVPAELTAGAAGAEPAPRAAGGPAAPCFASTARHEVEIGGRKAVGSAQRRLGRALLQQGCVLVGERHLRLVDYLAVPDARRPALRAALARAARPIGPRFAAGTGLEAWAESLAAELPGGTRRVRGDEGLRWLTA